MIKLRIQYSFGSSLLLRVECQMLPLILAHEQIWPLKVLISLNLFRYSWFQIVLPGKEKQKINNLSTITFITSLALSICTWFLKNQVWKSSLKNQVQQTGFSTRKNQLRNWFLQATQAEKNQFKIDQKSSLLNLIFPNWFFRNKDQHEARL